MTRPGPIAQRGSAYGLSTRGASVGTSTARLSVPRDRWTHVALTYDGATVRTYRNGVLVSTKRHRGAPAGGSSALRLGGFTGRLDDLRLYDGALTAQEITRDMRTPTEPRATRR